MRSMSLLAGAVALALVGAARADDDLIRLDGKGDDAEVQEARFVAAGGRGFVAGGSRGFVAGGSRGFIAGGSRGFVAGGSRGFVGYRGGYWGGGYRGGYWGGGYRGWGYAGYRPFWGVGYRPWYGGYYGGGYYGGGGYYSQPVYSDYGYYNGCSTDLGTPVPAYNLTQPMTPGVPMAPNDGTFPYDAPNNGVAPMPMRNQNSPPRDSRMVSLTSPQYQFLAFGETAPAPLDRSASTVPVSLTFPAFGEDTMPTGGFSGGTTVYTVMRK